LQALHHPTCEMPWRCASRAMAMRQDGLSHASVRKCRVSPHFPDILPSTVTSVPSSKMAMRSYQKYSAKLKSRPRTSATAKHLQKVVVPDLLNIIFGYAPCRWDDSVPQIGAQGNATGPSHIFHYREFRSQDFTLLSGGGWDHFLSNPISLLLNSRGTPGCGIWEACNRKS